MGAPLLKPPEKSLANRAFDLAVWGGVVVMLAISFKSAEMGKYAALFQGSDNMRQ